MSIADEQRPAEGRSATTTSNRCHPLPPRHRISNCDAIHLDSGVQHHQSPITSRTIDRVAVAVERQVFVCMV